MGRALEGLKVVEIGHVVAGPFCGALLGDFGADVIKVEEPKTGDSLRYMGKYKGLSFCIEDRNKKCVTLNLKSEEGKDIFRKLLSTADVLIENYRPGVLAKMGFSWDELQKINKKLVLVSISGYGQTGPYKDKPGYDSVGLAMGGLTYITGDSKGAPMRPGVVVADYATGLFAALGALLALYNRDVVGTGVGQWVDACLYESIMRFSESMIALYSYDGSIRERIGNGHTYTVPSGNFRTKDSKWMTLSVGSDKVFARFAAAIGRPDLLADERYATTFSRVTNRLDIEGITADWIMAHTQQECLDIFKDDVPITPIYNVADICVDPHIQAREAIVEVIDDVFGKIKMQGVVPKLSATPGAVNWSGPAMGSYNQEIYGDLLGFDAAQLEALKNKGII